MGMSARAHLAYGYDLGTSEDFKAAERGECGEPKLPWLTEEDDDEGEHPDFGTEAEQVLLASVGFTEKWTPGGDGGHWERKRAAEKRLGVELDYSGHADYAGMVLIATGSERSVEWDEVMVLDVDELCHEDRLPEWSKKLADALTALGITPTQGGPKWLVFPSYG